MDTYNGTVACSSQAVNALDLRMSRRGQEKYSKAVNALKKIVASGRDKASDALILPPKVFKRLDSAFSSIPPSSWRKNFCRFSS